VILTFFSLWASALLSLIIKVISYWHSYRNDLFKDLGVAFRGAYDTLCVHNNKPNKSETIWSFLEDVFWFSLYSVGKITESPKKQSVGMYFWQHGTGFWVPI